MNKSLSAIIVILLTILGFKSEASILDHNVERATKVTSDSSGTQNHGTGICGTKISN